MRLRVLESLADVPADEWNRLAGRTNPFVRHEFLLALEASGCVSALSGWLPRHLAVYDEAPPYTLLGAAPLYLKEHSYGEYVFDWAWADAYARAGLQYYPKLVSAVPFTPVSGPRLLFAEERGCEAVISTRSGTGDPAPASERAAPRDAGAATGPRLLCAEERGTDEGAPAACAPVFARSPPPEAHTVSVAVAGRLIEGALELARELDVSSLHWLFTRADEAQRLERHGHVRRSGYQFHWHNNGYRSFDDFLAGFVSAKRKKIRRERRYVREAGVEMRVLHGAELGDEHWRTFYGFYHATVRKHGAIPYLSQDFFRMLGRTLPQAVVMILALHRGECVAAALNLRGEDALYGRYWGGREDFNSLHFEACYYSPIEYCIAHGLKRFEAGAQGGHKLARGLLPVATCSAHWLQAAQFQRAVADYLAHERHGVEYHMDELREHAPFRRAAPAS